MRESDALGVRKVGTHAEDARLDLGVDELVAAVGPVGHQVEDPEGRLQGHNQKQGCIENRLNVKSRKDAPESLPLQETPSETSQVQGCVTGATYIE